MTHTSQQAADERAVFAVFCEAVGLDAHQFVQDAPDFIDSSRTLGVEMVEFHQGPGTRTGGSRMRHREAMFERLLSTAHDVAYAAGRLRDIDVYLFPGAKPPPRSSLNRVATAIAGVVRGGPPEGSAEITSDALPDSLSPFVSHISIGPTPRGGRRTWQVYEAALIDVDPAAVQRFIDEKAILLQNYRKRATQVWLLIHSGAWPCVGFPAVGRPSTAGRITSAAASHVFVADFDKVFFLDRSIDEVTELSIARRP